MGEGDSKPGGRAIGVDMSAAPTNTAACVLRPGEGRLLVEPPRRRQTDADLLVLLGGLQPGEVAGLDCPLGWPLPFLAALAAHAAHEPWPHRGRPGDEVRAEMRLRATDRVVHELTGRTPMSVSADRIGATAMRAAHLLDALGSTRGEPVRRNGSDVVIEVYPAAARRRWGLDPRVRDLAALEQAAQLDFVGSGRTVYAEDEHCFDALVAALVARAHQLGRTEPVPAQHQHEAAVEGWICLPTPSSLGTLAAGSGEGGGAR